MDKDPLIIEVTDYRVDDVQQTPALHEDEEPLRPGATTWSGEIHTGGKGCCLGFSATVFLILATFVLGVIALCWALITFLGWLF